MAPRSRSTLWRTQNFIRRSDVIDRVLDRSDIGADDVVYEIGAGTGRITERLSARSRRVIAIEKDPALCQILHQRFAGDPHVVVRCADFLEHPLPRGPYKVFANPPFDVTTAIVTKLVSTPVPPDDAFVAMQKEAADRYLGKPSETLYALLLKPWFALGVVHHFRRDDFAPVPGVDVVMLRLSKRDPPLIPDEHSQLYRDFVVACFTAWRPSIRTALARAIGSRAADAVLRAAHLRAVRRPRDVPFPAWLRLFHAAFELGGGPIRRVAGAEARLRHQQSRLRKRHRTRVTGPPQRGARTLSIPAPLAREPEPRGSRVPETIWDLKGPGSQGGARPCSCSLAVAGRAAHVCPSPLDERPVQEHFPTYQVGIRGGAGQMWHRALRDWPAGHVTPRLQRLTTRDSRCRGGLCACPTGARAVVRSRPT